MSAVTITQMAERVGGLLRARLGVRGDDLATQVRKAGRRLPKRVRLAAEQLAQAAEMAQNPKLLVRVDEGEVAQAYDVVVRHLGGVVPGARRRGIIASMAASVGFSILAVAALVVVYLVWRGFI